MESKNECGRVAILRWNANDTIREMAGGSLKQSSGKTTTSVRTRDKVHARCKEDARSAAGGQEAQRKAEEAVERLRRRGNEGLSVGDMRNL